MPQSNTNRRGRGRGRRHQKPTPDAWTTSKQQGSENVNVLSTFTTLERYPILGQCLAWPRGKRMPLEMSTRCGAVVEVAMEEVGTKYGLTWHKVEVRSRAFSGRHIFCRALRELRKLGGRQKFETKNDSFRRKKSWGIMFEFGARLKNLSQELN